MKRFALIAVVACIGLTLSWSARAGDMSGKWVQYRMVVSQGGETLDINFDDMEVPQESRGYMEFRDGKLFSVMTGDDADPEEIPFTANGDVLIVNLTDEMTEADIESVDLRFEGDDFVFTIVVAEGTMKNYYKKP